MSGPSQPAQLPSDSFVAGDASSDDAAFFDKLRGGGEGDGAEALGLLSGVEASLLDTLLSRFTAVDLSDEAAAAGGAPVHAPAPGPAPSVSPGVGTSQPGRRPQARKAASPDAAAEAARRAAAEALLRARQARASAALRGVEWMVEHTAGSEAELRAQALSAMTAAEFQEAIQERVLGELCGNPLCGNPLPAPPRGSGSGVRISSSKKAVYTVKAPSFCGPACALRARDIQVSAARGGMTMCGRDTSLLPCPDACLCTQATLPEEIPVSGPEPATPPREEGGGGAGSSAPRPQVTSTYPGAVGSGGVVTMKGTIVERSTVAHPQPPQAPTRALAAASSKAVDGYVPKRTPVPTVAAAVAPSSAAPAAKAERHVRWQDVPSEADEELADEEHYEPGQAFAEEDTAPIVMPTPSWPPVPLATARADVAAAVSFTVPEPLRASDYQAKVDRALAVAAQRAAADAAAAAAPVGEGEGDSDDDSDWGHLEDDEAFVKTWLDVSERVDDGPSPSALPAAGLVPSAGAAPRPPSIKSRSERRGAREKAALQQQPQQQQKLPSGPVFMFQTLAEGAFSPGGAHRVDTSGDGEGGDDGESQKEHVTNMGQYAFGQLTALHDDDDDGDEKEGGAAEGASSDEEPPAATAAPVDDDDDLGDLDAHVHGGHGWPGSDDDEEEDEEASGEEDGDGGGEPRQRPRGSGPRVHPLYGRPAKEATPVLSPFLQLWTCLDEWLTPASLVYLAGSTPHATSGDASNTILDVEGATPEEAAAAAHRAPPLAPGDARSALQALAAHLSTVTPRVRRHLGMSSAQGPADAALHGLLTTFALRRAVPSLVRRCLLCQRLHFACPLTR